MDAKKKGMSKGCMIALIVGLVIVFVVIALGIVCYIYKDEIVEIGLNKMTGTIATEMKENLPEGVTAEDVDKLMDEFKQAYKDKKIDQTEIQEISTMVKNMLDDKTIDQEEGRKFMETVRKAIDE
jgi:uncharacterized membrane-anchored protein YhcB (DUF1043 family)